MNVIPHNLRNDDLFVALCEALRWWISFDAAQLRILADRGNRLCADDVRRIAIQYNFIRNIRNADANCANIADVFANFTWNDQNLNVRAQQIVEIVGRRNNANGNIRIVSGATKLAWFASPDGWTPFDRLTSAAVGVKNIDTVVRMTNYYDDLQRRGFLEVANHIEGVIGAYLGSLPGTKVLDKFLMLNGDNGWASRLRPLALAFAETLPCALKTQLIEAGTAIVGDPACRLYLGPLP